MLRTRRPRNAPRTAATSAARPSRGERVSVFASPVIVSRVVHRLEDLTSELDLGSWQYAAATADGSLGILCDD